MLGCQFYVFGGLFIEYCAKDWVYLAVLIGISFSTLLWTGSEIYRQAPPMPERVVSADGQVIYTRAEIEAGRQVWQSIGGVQLG